MARRGERLLAVAALLLCAALCRAAPADFGAERASDDVRFATAEVLDHHDHGDGPFAIVDKRDARIYVFAGDGRLLGASAVLLGLTPGDTAMPGIAQRRPASLGAEERSTPAGRFETQPGHNDKGEAIVWIDYDASLAIHRLRPAPAQERRPERLASATAAEHRISFGCVIVPVAFYENVIATSLGARRGVVYVLPENAPTQTLFRAPALDLATR
jgi:hypothetical protein